MISIYYDEVKYEPPKQISFWLGGIGGKPEELMSVEESINLLAERVFGDRELIRGKEFHGKEIVHGKGAFRGVDLEGRIEVLKSLLSICIDQRVIRSYVKINPENIVAAKMPHDEVAFMYFVELWNRYLSKQSEVGMVFGDYDEPVVGKSVVSLSNFKKYGTHWQRAETIDRLFDTVHFAKSHHSRMIQLADVYLYCCQFSRYPCESEWRARVNTVIRESGVLRPNFCKEWPNEPVWYK